MASKFSVDFGCCLQLLRACLLGFCGQVAAAPHHRQVGCESRLLLAICFGVQHCFLGHSFWSLYDLTVHHLTELLERGAFPQKGGLQFDLVLSHHVSGPSSSMSLLWCSPMPMLQTDSVSGLAPLHHAVPARLAQPAPILCLLALQFPQLCEALRGGCHAQAQGCGALG